MATREAWEREPKGQRILVVEEKHSTRGRARLRPRNRVPSLHPSIGFVLPSIGESLIEELTLGLLLLSSSHVRVPSYLVESNDLERGIKLLQQRSKRARSTTDIEYIVSDPVVVQITGLAHPPRTMLILRRILVGRTSMTRIVAAPTPSDTARRATCRAQPPAVLTRAILSKPYSFNFKE